MAKKKSRASSVVYVLASIATVIIIAVVIFFYSGANSEGKRQYEAQIKQESQEFIDKLISELDQIDMTDQGLAETKAENGTAATSEVPSGIISDSEKQIIGKELAKLDDARKQQVLQTLSVSYSNALNQQKAEAFSMAAVLIEQGKADWAALKAKGENTSASKMKLASEYLAKSEVMEAQMDANFYALMAKMEKQLKAEGINPTNIIRGYEAQYEKIKEQNKKEMIDKAMAAIKH